MTGLVQIIVGKEARNAGVGDVIGSIPGYNPNANVGLPRKLQISLDSFG
jgi:hypothetical protein